MKLILFASFCFCVIKRLEPFKLISQPNVVNNKRISFFNFGASQRSGGGGEEEEQAKGEGKYICHSFSKERFHAGFVFTT